MNFRILGMACALMLGTIGASFAQSDCSEPLPPTPVDGAKATLKQIGDASHDSNVFIHQSDDYQACLVRYVKEQKTAATKNKTTFDDSIASDAQAKIDENQKLKLQVAQEFQKSFAAFCKANPTSTPQCKQVQ